MRGGARPGGGRPPGSRNLSTIARELKAQQGLDLINDGGPLPLDVIVARMRGLTLPDGSLVTDDQFQAAVAAAPYVHPRLASTDTTIKSDNVHRVVSDKPITEEEWLAEHATPANDVAASTEDESLTDAV